MAYSELIVDLFSTVFRQQKDEFDVSEYEIMDGMGRIGEVYSPDPNWEYKGDSPSYYYDDAAHRCAYLHKYAMVHTGLLCDLLEQALKVYAIKEVVDKGTDDVLKICSLGSGSGTDIVACLLVLKEYFESCPIKATLIDCCEGWEFVFEEIVSELDNRSYDSDMPYIKDFEYECVDADLLDFDDYDFEVTPAIRNADVVTMVKFVSAAACRNTRQMVKAIFRLMKPGALLLFVDNAAGGFHEMMSQTAEECGMKSVFEPLRHYHYIDEAFCREYCCWISQFEARVAVEVWKKTEGLPWNTTYDLRRQFFYRTRHLGAMFTDEDFPVLQSSVYRPIVMRETIERPRVNASLPIAQPKSGSEAKNNQKYKFGSTRNSDETFTNEDFPVLQSSVYRPIVIKETAERQRVEAPLPVPQLESASEAENNQKCCTRNLDETSTDKDFLVLQSDRCRNRRDRGSKNRRNKGGRNKRDRASRNRRNRTSRMKETIERQRVETPLPVAQPQSTSETKNNPKCCTRNLDETSTDKDFPALQSSRLGGCKLILKEEAAQTALRSPFSDGRLFDMGNVQKCCTIM